MLITKDLISWTQDPQTERVCVYNVELSHPEIAVDLVFSCEWIKLILEIYNLFPYINCMQYEHSHPHLLPDK